MKVKWTRQEFFERLHTHKTIAAVKSPKDIEKALANKERISAAFLLTGSILNVKRFVEVLQSEGIPVLVHAEKIGGLLLNNEGISFLTDYVRPFGIVTTKPSLIKKAKERKMFVVQRVFMIDSEVYHNVLENKQHPPPDLIEIMPSTLHDVIRSFAKELEVPVITGGLLSSPKGVRASLEAGAIAVSTSNESLWKMDFSEVKTLI
ncbi:glycerol-3-phosphate responsive antiterminator [Planomicrobium sp. YIM 101495]|uniref:glycerol-3-phosphate responsive antiterminator n=1 Tax=Planomicrobium sp. YIM 101495 TaxID=2665160 RepID=UPI0012B9CF5B|nr:glycerol-3-phosphate responsive antiterminator [Planomicrobium sp. YIM 101495]MTD31703.1 glycerol-3-phosphate responsive antiterminator [Planomicrobium sp. YIM 101495]